MWAFDSPFPHQTSKIMEEEYVLQKIQELMPEKEMPMGVSYVDLKNAIQGDLRKIMNSLLQEGKINYFKTLNGVTIYFDKKE